MATAGVVQFDAPAVVVPTTGLPDRGSLNPYGGLLDADAEIVRENARRIWNLKKEPRDHIARYGQTGEPVVLIAMQSGTSLPRARGIVAGMWEIDHCEYDGPKWHDITSIDSQGKKRCVGQRETDGYRFELIEPAGERITGLRG